MATTSKWALPYPVLADAADVPQWMQSLAVALDGVAMDSQGVIASRPVSSGGSPGKSGRYYRSTNESPNKLYRDHGTGYDEILIRNNDIITSAELAADSVGSSEIAADAVGSSEIAADAVGSSELANNAVDTAAIVDGNVTLPKLAVMPACRVYKSPSQAPADSVVTAVTFGNESFDTDAIHDNSTNNSRLTCKTAGLYWIGGVVGWNLATAGDRRAWIRLNGTTDLAGDTRPANQSVPTYLSLGTHYQLAVNDYVELTSLHTVGSNTNLQTGVGGCSFGMHLVSR